MGRIMGKVFFTTLDILDKMSGIELSVLNRSRLFNDFLNNEAVIITSMFNTRLHKNLFVAKQNSRAPRHLSVLNMYDYFQETSEITFPSNTNSREDFTPFHIIPVPNSPDIRLYNDEGNFVGHCVRNEDLSVIFINYLEDDFVCRRESYDCRGFLSRVELLEPKNDEEQVAHEIYYRVDGSVALIKRCIIINNLSSAFSIHVIDKKGQVVKMFKNENELLTYWLTLVTQNYPKAIFVIDRCAEFFDSLKKIKYSVSMDIKLIPVMHSVHTYGDPLVGAASPFYKSVIEDRQSSDAIITFTEAQKEDLYKRYCHTNVLVIPHAFDVNITAHKLNERNSHDVVYLARFAPEKNHNVAFDIFRLVVDNVPEAKLHCYGYGDNMSEITSKIAELNLQDNVFLHDFETDIGSIYIKAGLSILTSSIESQCMSVLESLSYGCPVVSFDIKYGPSSMIQEGVNGFLVPFLNTTAFADRIIEILNTPALHENLVKNASPSMESFTSVALSKKWSNLLEYIRLPKPKKATETHPVHVKFFNQLNK